jgi:hypothetical protein
LTILIKVGDAELAGCRTHHDFHLIAIRAVRLSTRRFRAAPAPDRFLFRRRTDFGVIGASHETRRRQSSCPQNLAARLVADKSMCFVAPPVRHSSLSTA